MTEQAYQCCNCLGTFYSEYYNWYAYYKKGAFHTCPECGCKLVANYDFEKTGLLDKITIRSFIIAALLFVVDYWGFYNFGYLYIIAFLIGGVAHSLYWWSLSDADKKLQDTKKLSA